jgi:sugar (pentulose or hexulose) kinase
MMAFDLGATSGKVFLGRFDGRSLGLEETQRFDNRVVAVNNDLYWDVLRIYANLKEGITESLLRESQITSIGLDSFSNDFGLLDRHGHFINQVFCYRDNRTQRNAEKIYAIMSKRRMHQLSGNQNALFPTLMQLASMRLEVQGFLLDGSEYLLFLPDLFNYFLTGEIGSEYTISSVSQLYDFIHGVWNREILETFQIPNNLLAPIVSSGTRLGRITDPALMDAKDVNVIAVCEHDTASAFLAAPFGDQAIIISSGTWSLVGVEASEHMINEYTFRHNIANEGGYPGHHRLLKNIMGLWLIEECRKTFIDSGIDVSISALLDMGSSEQSFRSMIFPNDERFFSPGAIPEKIKEYCLDTGQPVPDTPGQIIRCIIESLAFSYRYVIEELEHLTNYHYEKINIVGGGSNNAFLNQCVANATRKIVIAGPNEATAIGNILVQMITGKEIASIKEGRQIVERSFLLTWFHPQQTDDWNSQYGLFKKMVDDEVSENGL